jgi:hypothetical protein
MTTFDYKSEEFLKTMLFEIYSAGFEAGYSKNIDIVTAYNKWFDGFKNTIKNIEEL